MGWEIKNRIIFVKINLKENKLIIQFGRINEVCGTILNRFTRN